MNEEEKFEPMKEWGYRFLKPILSPLFKLYYRPKIYGSEVIPTEGPIILAGNHKHILDQCLVIISTKRVIHYMAKKEYFDGPFAWFFKFVGAISVDRSIHDEEAKRKAKTVLKQTKALGIFPEGTRNKPKATLLPFKKGTVRLAQENDATIVPFAIKGEYKFWKNDLRIIFGTPFKVSKDEDLNTVNERLYRSIEKILLDENF